MFMSNSNTPKRQRNSPGNSAPAAKKSLNMFDEQSTIQLSSMIRDLVSSLLDEKLAHISTKNDLTDLSNYIKALKEENTLLKTEIASLKELNLKMDSRLEELEISARAKNLIFKGVKNSPSDDRNKLCENVAAFCKEVLKVDVSQELLHARPLGPQHKTDRPLVATFSRLSDKIAVLGSSRSLKGTGFVVHQDFPEVTRIKRAKLSHLRREILKLNSNLNVRLRSNFLLVDGRKFTWSTDVGLLHGNENGVVKLSDLVNHDLSDFINELRSNSHHSSPSTRSQKPQ